MIDDDEDDDVSHWDWADIRRVDAQAQARVRSLPTCRVCGGHLCCGQRDVHHTCAARPRDRGDLKW